MKEKTNWLLNKILKKPYVRKTTKTCNVCGNRMDFVNDGNGIMFFACDYCDNVEEFKP